MAMKNKLIVALDVDTAAEARRLVNLLKGEVGMFKIGSQLFTAAGPEIVREIVNQGERVFLDLKFHDIPNTVAAAAVEATRLGVSIFNVHAAGGSEMMRWVLEAVDKCVEEEGLPRPLVIAVTILTSANKSTLAEIGYDLEPASLVQRFALLAEASGMDGVVASPNEVALIRSSIRKPQFVIITPGVRPAGASTSDQKRVTTPRDAISAGADYLVIGRPILGADDPVLAARQIVEEMESSVASGAAI